MMRRKQDQSVLCGAPKAPALLAGLLVGMVDDGRAEVSPVELANGRRYVGFDYENGAAIACLELTASLRQRFESIVPEAW